MNVACLISNTTQKNQWIHDLTWCKVQENRRFCKLSLTKQQQQKSTCKSVQYGFVFSAENIKEILYFLLTGCHLLALFPGSELILCNIFVKLYRFYDYVFAFVLWFIAGFCTDFFFWRGREKLRRKYVIFYTVTFLCRTCSHAKFELLLWMRENFHGTVDFW